MNLVAIEGRLGKDPEVRYTTQGTAVCNLSLAHNHRYNGNEQVNWIPVICWNKLADAVGEYLKKGSRINVAGRLQQRTWTDKDGNKRFVLEVVAQNIDFLDPKNNGAPAKAEAEEAEPEEAPVDDGDSPF